MNKAKIFFKIVFLFFTIGLSFLCQPMLSMEETGNGKDCVNNNEAKRGFDFKVDIFEQIRDVANFKYELYILDKTIDELNKIITTGSGKSKEAAKFALTLIEQKKIKKISGYWTVMNSTMYDLKTGHQTQLVTQKIKYDQGLPDKLFSKRALSDDSTESGFKP